MNYYRIRIISYKLFLLVFLSLITAHRSLAGAVCDGRVFNPVSEVNYLANMFPIQIGFVNASFGGGFNSPLMVEPPVCICPSHVPPNPPISGLGMTYWEPLYLVETTRKVGCSHSFGGIQLPLAPLNKTGSASTPASGSSEHESDLLYIHWYLYPVFSILKIFSDGICQSGAGVLSGGYFTEVDPTWADDKTSLAFTPESILFSNLPAQTSCIIDAISTTVGLPLEPLFWCIGSWGGLYPLSGNTTTSPTYAEANIIMVMKLIQKWARIGNMRTTIGPGSQCFSTFMPLTPKAQWRIDTVYPVPNFTPYPVFPGKSATTWGYVPPSIVPTRENTSHLLFLGTQCCLRP